VAKTSYFAAAKRRPAFTVIECIVALALILIVSAIVAQTIVWGLQERSRSAAHYAALETAANILEEARAQPFDKLDKTWADAQHVPTGMDAVLPEGKVTATIAPEPKLAGVKRVTVVVSWQFAPQPADTVELTTLISARTAKKTGGAP
jgi:prepilin-type N-terminal cleavage/methylation domain-containing protein